MKEILDTVLFILRNRPWLSMQATFLAFAVINSFFSLYLLNNDFSEQAIMLTLLTIYLGKAAIFIALKRCFLQYSRQSESLIRVCITGFLLAMIFSLGTLQYAAFSLSIFFLIILRDLASITGMGNLHICAEAENRNEVFVLATAMVTGVLLSSIVLPVTGMLSSHHEGLVAVCSLAFMTLSLLIGQDSPKTSTTQSATTACPIPPEVKQTLRLSFILNANVSFGRVFVMPSLIFVASSRLGMTQSSYVFLGMLLGVTSLISLTSRAVNIQSAKPGTIMLVGFFISSLIWLLIGIASYLYIETSLIHYLIAALALTLLLDVIIKLWGSGYLTHLRVLSRRKNTDTNANYNSYYYEHINYGTLGAGFAFTAGFWMSEPSSANLVLCALALASIGYGLVYAITTRNAHTPAPSPD